MRRHEKLLTELATALRAKSEAKKVWADKKADALEARGEYNEKVALVEEIQQEIETGSTGRPLFDEIEAKEAAQPAPAPPEKPKPAPPPDKPRPAAKKKSKAQEGIEKLTGLELPTAKAIMDELVEQDAQERSGTPSGAADPAAGAAPADGGGSKPAVPYRQQKAGEKPFWESADLDLELMHAIFYGGLDWVELAKSGASNEQILENLASKWPVFRVLFDADDSGGPYGYTIACPGGVPTIWVGPYLGSHHKPSASGHGLAERVRQLLKLRRLGEPHISANGTGFTTPRILEQDTAGPPPSPEDRKPIRRQSGRGPR